LWKVNISFIMSVCPSVHPHGTTRLPLDGSLWNLIFEYYLKICWENLSLIKIWQDWLVLYAKTNAHFWSYLTHFVEWEMFHTTVAEKVKTHILWLVTFFLFLNFCSLWDNVEKYCRARQATDDNIIRCVRIACCISKAADTHSEYVIPYFFSSATMVVWMCLNITLCVCCLSSIICMFISLIYIKNDTWSCLLFVTFQYWELFIFVEKRDMCVCVCVCSNAAVVIMHVSLSWSPLLISSHLALISSAAWLSIDLLA
jgi:hypothetical protein